jgi:hypothetical protein
MKRVSGLTLNSTAERERAGIFGLGIPSQTGGIFVFGVFVLRSAGKTTSANSGIG